MHGIRDILGRRGKPRFEYRRVPYRPPRKERRGGPGGWSLYLRFFRDYMLPHRYMLAVCIVLASLNACSVYLMAYYGRVVVDDILVVAPADSEAETASGPARGISARDRQPAGHPLPPWGRTSERQQAISTMGRPANAMGRLMGIFAIYLLTILVLNGAARLSEQIRIRMSQRVTGLLRETVHRKILALSRAYHQAHPPGRLMARIFSDASSIQARMFRTVVDTGSSVLMFVVGLAILLVLDWRIAAAAALVMVPYFSVIRRVRIRLSAVNTELWHTNSCLWGLAAQKLDSVKAIFAYGRERHESLNFHRLTACFTRDALAQQRLSAGLSRSTQIITGLTTAAIFVFCAQQVLGAEMTLGEMMYVYGAAANLFTPVLGLSDISLVLMDLLVVLRRMTEVLDEQREIREAPGAVDFPLRLNSGIELRHLNFAYGEDPDDLVLRNINLTVPAGKWVCIMGPSGSGKTTLINLIARLYDPVEGEILADGIPLSKIKFVSLRTRMALVPQEPQILSGTIRDNITYGFSDAEPGTILAAARAAECHDFIMDLDVKYETMVGERGITLSGGQRQRLSIARALITNPDVLLLDDCTSALDAETEQRIQETLSRLMAGKTALVVSQRVSMAMRCHEICVLEDGAITERGTHAELVARGGFYARLYAQQTQGAEPAKPQ